MINVARLNNLKPVNIDQFLSLDRLQLGCHITSKKRLMERIADLLTHEQPTLDRKTVLHTLNERERLGSTGIGCGVALPHGRMNGLDSVIGAAAILKSPLEYDAIDDQPIQLAFGLLVPAEATDQHLEILAHLAKLFSDADLRQLLINASSKDEAFELLTGWGMGA